MDEKFLVTGSAMVFAVSRRLAELELAIVMVCRDASRGDRMNRYESQLVKKE